MPLRSSRETHLHPTGVPNPSASSMVFLLCRVPGRRFVDSAMRWVYLLQRSGVKPYVVLDGSPIPAKQETRAKRTSEALESMFRPIVGLRSLRQWASGTFRRTISATIHSSSRRA